MMKPILFEDSDVIAEKVAQQMGISPEEAAASMKVWDELAVRNFCVGNDIPAYLRN